MLEAGRGREVRFDFQARPGDSASFRFDASSGTDADAVAFAPGPAGLPAHVVHRRRRAPRHRLGGDLAARRHRSRALDPAVEPRHLAARHDPRRRQWLRVYPYWCSEQVSSAAEPLVALYRAGPELGVDSALMRTARNDLERAVATLSRRQRSDGGIGLWSADDWTTPWLTAYAGSVLLDAKAAGPGRGRFGARQTGRLSGAVARRGRTVC